MSDTPKLESIMQNVLASMQGVTEEEGYLVDLDAHRLNKASKTVDKPTGYTTLWFDGLIEPEAESSLKKTYDARIIVRVHQTQAETDATPTDQYLILAWAEVYAKLREDLTRGGFAMNTKPQPMDVGYLDDQVTSFVDIPVLVTFRFALDDPFTE